MIGFNVPRVLQGCCPPCLPRRLVMYRCIGQSAIDCVHHVLAPGGFCGVPRGRFIRFMIEGFHLAHDCRSLQSLLSQSHALPTPSPCNTGEPVKPSSHPPAHRCPVLCNMRFCVDGTCEIVLAWDLIGPYILYEFDHSVIEHL